MNHGLRVALASLLCACGPIDVVGTVSSDAGRTAIPVVMPDAAADPRTANDATAQHEHAGAAATPQDTASDAAVSIADTGASPAAGQAAPAPPAADGCSVDNAGPCSHARVQAFSHALCACGDVAGPSGLAVLAGSSARCAPVGVNGNFAVAVLPRAGGDPPPNDPARDPRAANPGFTAAASSATIGGDLEVGGVLSVSGNMHVAGDVWSQSVPVGTGMLQVDGDLHTTEPAVVPATNLRVSGMQRFDAHTKVAPCACEPSLRLDIAGLVSAAAQHNDNASHAIAADGLADANGANSIELNCGRYYLRGVTVLGNLTLRVRGRVQLFVQGDFAVQGETNVEPADGAELDLIVGGNLTLGASARFADAQHAGSGRVYVAGQLLLGLQLFAPSLNGRGMGMQLPMPLPAALTQTPIVLIGNVYAPSAVLQLAQPTDVVGSLFVGGLVLLQELSVHSASPASGGSCGL